MILNESLNATENSASYRQGKEMHDKKYSEFSRTFLVYFVALLLAKTALLIFRYPAALFISRHPAA